MWGVVVSGQRVCGVKVCSMLQRGLGCKRLCKRRWSLGELTSKTERGKGGKKKSNVAKVTFIKLLFFLVSLGLLKPRLRAAAGRAARPLAQLPEQ